MHINTYRLSENPCNPYCNSTCQHMMCGHNLSRHWKSKMMYEVNPLFVPRIPSSDHVCKHTIKQYLGCGRSASFSFLFILFNMWQYARVHARTFCLKKTWSKMLTPFQRTRRVHSQQLTLFSLSSSYHSRAMWIWHSTSFRHSVHFHKL